MHVYVRDFLRYLARAGCTAIICLPAIVHARPIVASATVHRAEPGAGAKEAKGKRSGSRAVLPLADQATLAARKRALELALDELEVRSDAPMRRQVLAQYERWTASFRLLRNESVGDAMLAEVEVEVDTVRLEKATENLGAQIASGSLPQVELRIDNECTSTPGVLQAAQSSWEAQGGSVGAGSWLLEISSCEKLGPVRFTGLIGARGTAHLQSGSSSSASSSSASRVAFAAMNDSAVQKSVIQVVGDLADALVARRGEYEVIVAQPWKAAHIRHLELALRTGVRGVSRVEIQHVNEEGGASLKIQSALSVQALQEALSALVMPAAHVELAASEGNTLSVGLVLHESSDELISSPVDDASLDVEAEVQ